MRRFFLKYRHLFEYGIFGVITTIINISIYLLLYEVIGSSNVFSNVIAWITGVAFAFITNKLWVFESKEIDLITVFQELLKFTLARLGTGLIDLVIMYVSVDLLNFNAAVFKVTSNVIVIILNYVLSKLVVFKRC